MKSLYWRASMVLLLTAISGQLIAQTVWKVNSASSVITPAGKVWNDAFSDLKVALDSANSGDTIFVSEGTYYPDRGTADRDSSFHMQANVVILGGFSVTNNDTNLSDRDVETYVTILSGEIQQDADSTNNSFVIVRNNVGISLTNSAVLDGFTITRAHNTNTVSNLTSGGGMLNSSASPTINNCIFTLNTIVGPNTGAVDIASGAGMYNTTSSPVISNCTFTYNITHGNSSSNDHGFGGAISNVQTSSPTISNTTFRFNEANGGVLGRGGCIYNINSSRPVLTNCVMTNNLTTISTPGSGNTSNGAGVFNQSSSSSQMTNCLIADNTSSAPLINNSIAYGAAICNFFSATYVIAQTTITNNSATGGDGQGGGMWGLTGSPPTIVNSIIYGNTASSSGNDVANNSGSPGFSYSNIGGCGGSSAWLGVACGTDNGGNIDADPIFVDESKLNYALDTCSPAFNVGLLSNIPVGITTDLNGENRIKGDSVDMGAFEKELSSTCLYTWDGSTDTDWGTASNWNRNEVPPTFASISIPNVSNDPVLDTIRSVGSIDVETGGVLTLNKERLNIYGNLTTLGTINNDSSVVAFQSNEAQSIAGVWEVDTLIINSAGGVTIGSGNTQIKVEVRPENGVLSTGGFLTLLSDSNVTGRIAEIQSGASISGSVTAQQYIKGATDDWRFFSSPIQGRTIADWNDDIITSGFTGSDFPSFGFINIYTYDETVTGTQDNGFVGASNITDAIETGEGHMIYLGGGADTVDVTGTIHSGDITINLDFTSTPSVVDDGWNLIGNPYPSAVDFGALTLTANVTNGYHIYNPSTGNYASWDESITSGTNGADGNIAQGQGFWVQTSSAAPTPTITFQEADKVQDAADFFFRLTKPNMILSLYDGNKFYDDALLRTEEKGSGDYGWHDTRKLYNADTTIPALAFISDDFEELSINTISSQLTANTVVPIQTNGKTGVRYKISFKNSELLTNEYCVELYNAHTNTSINIADTSTYEFTLPRAGINSILELRITPSPIIGLKVNNIEHDVADLVTVCEGDELTLIAYGDSAASYQWNNAVVNNEPFGSNVGTSTYEVLALNSNLSCSLSNQITIETAELPTPEITQENGMLKTGDYAGYQWLKEGHPLSGETNRSIKYDSNGKYSVRVINDAECEGESNSFDVQTTGISVKVNNEQLKVYPNPGNDLITLEMEFDENALISITNVLGTVVKRVRPENRSMQQINVEDLDSGVYFIAVESGEATKTIKWVKR